MHVAYAFGNYHTIEIEMKYCHFYAEEVSHVTR